MNSDSIMNNHSYYTTPNPKSQSPIQGKCGYCRVGKVQITPADPTSHDLGDAAGHTPQGRSLQPPPEQVDGHHIDTDAQERQTHQFFPKYVDTGPFEQDATQYD